MVSDRFIFGIMKAPPVDERNPLKKCKMCKNILNFSANSAIIFFVQSVGTASIHNFPVFSS